ncbi:MAG: hypothetical protein FWF15_11920 [Oscillospiraceae bacterium]|nr:hypothetical protein [Oscillospiraceae bacterium]
MNLWQGSITVARQCLHAGYSDDGLKTICGGNIVLKKQKRDPDKILNCYPFVNVASENEVFLRPFVVDSGDNEKWSEPTGYLMRLDPANLLSQDITEDFSDGAARWVTKSEVENGMLAVRAIENNIGYSCLNFSFARKGNIEIKFDSVPPGTIIALSNYYIDNLSFTNNEQRTRFSSYLTSFTLSEKDITDGCFNIVWDKDTAYNHLYFIIYFISPEDAEGTLLLKSVQIQTDDAWLDTGIEY